MQKKYQLFLYAALAFCSASSSFAADAKIYFEENFRNYSDNAPGISAKGMSVGNDPIWADMAELNVRAEKNCNVFDSEIKIPNLSKFDLAFKFRFMNATQPVMEKKKGKDGKPTGEEVLKTPGNPAYFDLVFTESKGKKQTIRFASDKVTIGSVSQNIPFMPNWKWEDTVIKFDGKTITVFISKDRELQKIVSAPFSGSISNVNFAAEKDKHFAISFIMLSDPSPLKAYPVQKHFADFKSIQQPIVNPGSAREASIQPVKGFMGIRFQPGQGNNEMRLSWSDGSKEVIPIQVTGETRNAVIPVLGQPKGAKLTLDDAVIALGKNGTVARQYVRPHLKMFQSSYDAEPQYIDILREWNKLPPASKHPLDLDFVSNQDGSVDLFLDASFIKKLKGKNGATLQRVDFKFAPDAVYSIKKDRYNAVDLHKYYVIDLSANPRAKTFADAKSSIKQGVQTINGVPFDVAAPIDSADVAICKQGKGNWALEVEEYHGRSPLDGFPSAIHYRLPSAPYGKAYLLCAIDPDPAKVKILTTRVGYYVTNGSGGNMLADNVIDLTDGKMPSNFKQVGTIELKGNKVPLYMVEIQLALGNILDIPARKEYVDFEFTGKGWINTEQLDNTMKPDPYVDSAFNIFAVTLEKAPVLIDVKQSQPGNIFTEDESNKKTSVTLKAMNDNASGKVNWTATDINGKEVFKGSAPYKMAKANESSMIDIPLSGPIGFYDLKIAVTDANGKELFIHPARFAILGKDKRKATKEESPFATWWFNAHGSPGAMDLGGPILKKAGIRRASWNEPTKEASAKYNITNTGNIMCPGMRDFDATTGKFKSAKIKVQDPSNPKKKIDKELTGEENFKMKLMEQLANKPNANHILIWHESAPGYGIPEELLSMNTPSEEEIKKDERLAKYINEAGRLIRKYAPQLKIQIGNSSASIGASTRPLRAGADPQYYDYIGIETPSQVIPPERLQEVGLQGMLISKEIANKLAKGKKDIKLNGSWEFTYRCERDMGEQQQAEWYMRDVLISLSHDFFLVSPGILFDCLNGYYNGLWGGSGMLLRDPYVYPKRSYVAYAALTNVLDRVKFSRQIPTGSTTVYALEFKRADGKFATALWAARGEVKFALDNPSGKAEVTEMYGKTVQMDGKKIVVDGGTSPCYILTDKPLASVSIAGRTFKKDQALADKAQVAAPFDNLAKVELKPDLSMESTHTSFLPILKPADFSIKQVKDDTMGDCIEVTLDLSKDKYKSKYITEYTTVRLKQPATVPGNPEVIGMWVKGNSNWGQIRFEIEDANGEVFKNLSTGRSWGCDIMDWPGNLAVNFDGWGYVYQPLFPTKLVNDHSPGPYSDQWVSEGGNKKIELPVKIRAVTIGVNREKLDLLDFKKSAPAIRIKNAGGISK